ncbi:MAG: adenine deaminase [Oscillospiraceae bacterium]|nr:adenine deaminase [Oscillospiraceae bacterium]
MNKELLAVAKGNKPADLVVTNGKIVNVYSGEIYEGGVAVCGDTIAAVGDVAYCIGEGTKVIDAQGNYLTPGFLDGHIHPESSSLAIRPFAEAVLAHGTTGIMTDLHEIGVVSGLEGIEAVLKEAEATDLKVYFIVPSHVPFAPNLETSGGHFDPAIIRKALQRKDAVGLSECVGHYIVAEHPELLESFDDTLSMPGKTLQGHLPAIYGPNMAACAAAGVATCHESFCEQDVYERLRNGIHLQMREGSAARNMQLGLLKAVIDSGVDTTNVSIVTDDLHTCDLKDRGHMDDSLRTAFGQGLDFLKGIQMVTINCARAFKLDDKIGSLTPGRRADINITTGSEDFKVLTTFAGGKQITDNGNLLVHYEAAEHEPCILNTMHLVNPITADSFKMHVSPNAKKAKVICMDTLPYIPFTSRRDVELDVVDGVIQCDTEQDVLYIAQVERHGVNGNIGKAFMGGFHIKGGALASSVGHDNHNIIVMGDSFEDMALAVNRCVELGGGQVIVRNGEVAAEVAYPICGLMSDLSLDELAAQKKALNAVAYEMGTPIQIPFMFLCFICLACIEAYAVTDKGFIDVEKGEIIDPILEVIE